MQTYDSLIRVSKMNGRTESAESTMTIEDQRRLTAQSTKAVGGRRGRELLALDQSGFDFLHSDEVQTALARIRNGQSAGVVVAYGDRMMRNWWRLGIFFEELAKIDGQFIVSGMEHIDYRTPIGRSVFGGMAQASEQVYFAAKSRGDNIADAVIARGVPNRVPYGYRRNADEHGVKTDPDRDSKALVPDEQAAAIVRRIFRMRLDGNGWAVIVRTLNEAGVPAPNGGGWVQSSVRGIVENETYTGVVILGKRRIEGAHEALVTPARWRRVQSTRTVGRTGNYVAGIAGGLLVCSTCGLPLSVVRSGKGRASYGCRRLSSAGRCTRPVYVSKVAADEYVHDAVRDVLSRGTVHLVSSARELEQARRALDRARAEREAFVKVSSALDEADFTAGYAQRKEKETNAAHIYDELLARAADAEDLPTSAAAYDALDLTHQRRVAHSLIARIVVVAPLSRSKFAPIDERFALDWKSAA